MDLATLKHIITRTPNMPGVYRFQNARGDDIYIGKASSLKKRLLSYLKTPDSRIRQMVSTAEKLIYIETESDIEALILESQLIKQRRPDFNIMLRDDKQYFFIGFTHDEFPRVFLTHQPYSAAGRVLGPRPGGPVPSVPPLRGSPSTTGSKNRPPAEFIGPFTDGVALKATLKFLRNIFPYCTCTQKHHNFCLNYHIGKCPGFCCLKNPDPQLMTHNQQLYNQNIKALKDILTGRKSTLIKDMKKQMAKAGQDHDFGRAIELRDKLERLERVFYNAQVINNSEILKEYSSGLQKLLKIKKPIIRIEGYDISNIQGKHATGAMVTFIQGQPDKNQYRKFNIKGTGPAFAKASAGKANDTGMLREIIGRRFRHVEWPFPDLILVDGGKGQVNAVLAQLQDMSITIPVIGISKNDKHLGHQLIIPGRKLHLPLTKLSVTDKNLLLQIDTEAHRFAISHYRKLHGRSLRD
jgi:excinuclease ABC subunit C